ncbi:MAG: ABC transporter ATP-binding protein [Rhizobiales bacterium]|nr:ABC transporter ATP-binding protein [Hyphomicrobiales bacterium]NRB15862.1 ABC transporter ATP-binding protein [Hyphomicrobiales bacterium]
MYVKKLNGTVRFENVVKKFGNFTALKQMSLTINPGELVTLLGPSGCGKTTTLRLVAGLEAPTQGKIFIGDKEVTHLSATHRNVSMVFQSYALFPHMTILENVSYGLDVAGVAKVEAIEKAREGLALVGLIGMEKRLPSELSGGQQQRVAVARAIVLEPEVLLLDEPLSNLDAKLRRVVREEIRQIQQKLGFTALYVTHDQEEAMAVSDQIIVMKDTEIVQQGTPRDLYDHPNSEFIANFIGDANVIDCEIVKGEQQYTSVMINKIKLEIDPKYKNIANPKLVIRPQDVALSNKPNDKNLHIQGVVQYVAYLGSHLEYSIDTEMGEIFVIDREMKTFFKRSSHVFLDFNLKNLALVNH